MNLRLAFAGASMVLSTTLAQAFPIASTGDGFVVIATGGEVIATYEGNSASFSNDLYLVNTGQFLFNNHASAVGSTISLGSFAAGVELMFRLHVNNTGFDYFTGPGSRNPDGQAHARVEQNFGGPGVTLVSFEDLFNGPFDFNDLSFSFSATASGPSNRTPEPPALILAALGLLALAASRRRPEN